LETITGEVAGGTSEALDRLAIIDPQQSRVVELRIFGGLTVEETAEVMGILSRTVKREWSMARAWLRQQIKKTAASHEWQVRLSLLLVTHHLSLGTRH